MTAAAGTAVCLRTPSFSSDVQSFRLWPFSPSGCRQNVELRGFPQPRIRITRFDTGLIVLAGRRNQTGGTSQRRKTRDRVEKGVKLTRKLLSTPSTVPRNTQDMPANIILRDDQAIGQVISAKANYMCVLVTNCLEATPQPADKDQEFQRSGSHDKSMTSDPGSLYTSRRVGTELLCVVRALLKKLQQRVLVGDQVLVGAIDWIAGRGMIEDVLPRSSEIIDPPIANVDHVLLLFALQRPQPEITSLSRFLVAAEATGVSLSLAFNKVDLVPPHVVSEWRTRLESWGYNPYFCSLESKEGVGPLAVLMRSHVSVVAGPSGVGKSSLINALRGGSIEDSWQDEGNQGEGAGRREEEYDSENKEHRSTWLSNAGNPLTFGNERNGVLDGVGSGISSRESEGGQQNNGRSSEGEAEGRSGEEGSSSSPSDTWQMLRPGFDSYAPIKVGQVSDRSGRGRHTTRHVTLLQLPGSGLLADTPGFSQPSLATISSKDLPSLFPEIRRRLGAHPPGCAFADCHHLAEPGCCVGSEWDRFRFYSLLMEELVEREEAEMKSRGTKREGKMRFKVGALGVVSAEPLLEMKKHRRESRRTEHQKLEDDTWEEEREEEKEARRSEEAFGVSRGEGEEGGEVKEDVEENGAGGGEDRGNEDEGEGRLEGGEEADRQLAEFQKSVAISREKEISDVRRFKKLLQSQR